MNFANYVNTYTYPTKSDFTSTYYYKEGKLVATSTVHKLKHIIEGIELKDCTKEEDFDRVAFTLERNNYHHNGKLLLEQFKVDLADELGLTGHAKWDKLYSLATEYGDGFEDIYNKASDLAELLY